MTRRTMREKLIIASSTPRTSASPYIGYRLLFIALSLFDIIGAIILWILIQDPEKRHPQMMEQ
ncbi:hypothetical protein FNJ20_21745 [Salmonella enterica subsp. salamae]|nr:hypothetical protein [Salmonella enterica subsp. salamae]